MKREDQVLSFGKGWTIDNMVLPHVFVIFTGDKRPFDPGGVNCVYELGRVLRLIKKPHGTGLMDESFSSMWQDRHQRPQYIKISGTRAGKEKGIKKIKPRIIEIKDDEYKNRKNFHSYLRVSKLFQKYRETGLLEIIWMLSLLIKAAYGEDMILRFKLLISCGVDGKNISASMKLLRSDILNSLSEDDMIIVIVGLKVSSPEEVVEDQIHDKLTIRWEAVVKEVIVFRFEIGIGQQQRGTTKVKQNLEQWYDCSVLEFLKSKEAGSSMFMVLYNNTELINYLKHWVKSCLVPMIRIEDVFAEVRIVKMKEEYFENHLASTLAFELFHSPRPPELSFGAHHVDQVHPSSTLRTR